jgi:hypothetical protein
MNEIPRLIGVIHLDALPGSPRAAGPFSKTVERAATDARHLADAGFEAAIVENYGDVPFTPGRVDPCTVACMTACALGVRRAAPHLALGINVLRNDARAALGIAAATEASFIRINVHTGARITDQGLVQGEAYDTLRRRSELGLGHVRLLCDIAVKHSAPLGDRLLEEEAQDAVERGLADAALLTGSATGRPVRDADVLTMRAAVKVPVLVASGATPDRLSVMNVAHGVIVGSWLRASGKAGDPVDPARAKQFVEAFRAATKAS